MTSSESFDVRGVGWGYITEQKFFHIVQDEI